ncbi:MAG: response regulator [candidate division KSB1 bacterium]|nr:response regulator [candidate division KSB1 bacterium]MDZ7368699.1 response regulator [candidate division KSB1 bacterium]MDZ7406560.1 response regulator [candidate division KSB1 bacterium]
MKKHKLLLADNDAEFLHTRKEILEAESYDVVSASSPEEAKALLQDQTVDLAIVDLRLRDDKDEADISGLALIKSAAPHVPKILMTAYPTVEMARRALKRDVDDIPAAVDLVAKQEGVEVLLRAVSQAMKNRDTKGKPQPRRLRLVAGGVVAIGMMVLLWEDGVKGVLVAVFAGVAIELISALFTKLTGLK